MKVLMFGWEFPPHISGGLGTACYGLTTGLAKQKVDVLFVLPRLFGDEEKSKNGEHDFRLKNASDVTINFTGTNTEEFWKKISFMEVDSVLIPYMNPQEYYNILSKEFGEKFQRKSYIFSERFEFTGKYGNNLMDEVMRYALVAAKIADSETFDLIHAHDWLTYPAGIAAKEVSGKPLIVHVHATEFDRSGENINQYVYDIERKGMEAADKVITVSSFTKNIVVNRYGIPPEKIEVVHNAVDLGKEKYYETYKKHVKEKVVTFLGRVTFQKGPDYFVESAYKVLQYDSNVRFVMAGKGDMLYRMIRRVAQLGISTKFHFTGFLEGSEVDELLNISDVYVMPSVSEPFGISPLEAIRSNTPVIISKQSGVAEVLRHAIKVDFWDVDALANYIYGLLHYDALSKMFIKYGKEEVDNLLWDDVARKVNTIYQEILVK